MNVENIKKVRDHLAQLPAEKFSMRTFDSVANCGTIACIAGWAKHLLNPSAVHAETAAINALGLTKEQAYELFWLGDRLGPDPLWDAGPQQAVSVLDHLIATGEVDWTVAEQVTA
jgi:hypothetical protein